MRLTIAALAAAAATLALAVPANAQDRRGNQGPAQPSPLAQQAMSSGDQPDVLLDVPNLSVESITLEVNNLDVDVALDARLANLLSLSAGAKAHIDNVKLDIKGVQAQVTLIVRLDNVRAIIERTLQTLDNNPQIVTQLLSSVDNTVNTVGGVANRALPVVGGVANNAVNTVGTVAGAALRNGQLLDLARSGLTAVSQTVNSAGQTVRRVRDSRGRLLEVVTDSANRIVSSRPLGQ
jgi:hypothetical protein